MLAEPPVSTRILQTIALSDVSMEDLLDQIKKDSSQQESKAKNGLYKAPRAVRKAVEAPGLLFVFDPRKGQL